METHLTPAQWQVIKKHLPHLKMKRKHSLKKILEAMFYVVKTGCHWRMLPKCYPKWQLVYYYFSKWRDLDIWQDLNDMIREQVRQKLGKKATASVGIIDSQSVSTTTRGGLRGIDGNKKVKGRKRHIVVDTQGNLLTVLTHVANIHDSKGADLVFKRLSENIRGIKKIFADSGYRGQLIERAKIKYGYSLEIVKKTTKAISPKRWIVERTFAWMQSFRRLSKDFEYLLESSEAMVYLASLRLLLNKF